MNQLSLQIMTWTMVSTAVTTAVWLAMVGDAASLAGADRTLATSPAKVTPQRAIRPVVFHPAAAPQIDARQPVTLAPVPPRSRNPG